MKILKISSGYKYTEYPDHFGETSKVQNGLEGKLPGTILFWFRTHSGLIKQACLPGSSYIQDEPARISSWRRRPFVKAEQNKGNCILKLPNTL